MLQHAAALSDDYEYAIVWWGQSNSRPRGTQAEGIAAAPELTLAAAGIDLAITSGFVGTQGSSVTITTATTLTASAWVGAELRLGSKTAPLAGYGTVASCKASTSSSVTFTDAGDYVNWASHGLTTGVAVVFTGTTPPSGLTLGVTYYVIYTDADRFQVAASVSDALTATEVTFGSGAVAVTATTQSWLTVTWAVAADTAATTAWIHKSDRCKSYPNVRVLTPYQPEQGGAYPTTAPSVPGYAFPSTITSWEDAALFLPFTFLEGVAGPGATGTCSSTATVVTITSGAPTVAASVYIGGTVIVTKASTGAVWRGTITASGANLGTVTVASWVTASTVASPDGLTGLTYEVHLPYWTDNPHHAVPGPGFRYPNNDMQPKATLLNRPAGVTTAAYGSYFGAMIACAWRLSQQIGKRVNVIHLGINASTLVSTGTMFGGSPGQVGWFGPSTRIDWTPNATGGLAERIETLVSVAAPAALTAEGNTKPLKILGIVQFQGESEAGDTYGREAYADALPAFYTWLRGVIEGADLSPYSTGVKVPCVIARIPTFPWETDIPSLGYDGDTEGQVNQAMVDFTALDGFGTTIDTNNSPQQDADPLHFDGEGEAINGALAADAMLDMVGLAFSLSERNSEVKVCNLALSYLGESPISSLDPTVDSSVTASLCARFYATTRDDLLGRRAWSFATKRKVLQSVTCDWSEYEYAYGVPADCLRPQKVLPPDGEDDDAIGVSSVMTPCDVQQAPTQLPKLPFSIEQNADGNRILYTDTEDAVLRYTAKVGDVSLYPPWFTKALAWLLAADLAGALIKGDKGAEMTVRCAQMAEAILAKAGEPEGAQRLNRLTHNPRSITGR